MALEAHSAILLLGAWKRSSSNFSVERQSIFPCLTHIDRGLVQALNVVELIPTTAKTTLRSLVIRAEPSRRN